MSAESGVQAFCNISGALFGEEVSIKDFRLAKAGRSSRGVISRLWSILHSLACQKPPCQTDSIVVCTKNHVSCSGYRRFQFYSLPDDMSEGSKELLMSLSWVISEQAIEKKIDSTILMNPYVNSFLGKGGVHIKTDISDECSPAVDSLNFIIRTAGKIKLKMKFIQDLLLERSSLIYKVQMKNGTLTLGNRMSILQLIIMSRNHCAISTDESYCYSLIEFYIDWALKAKQFFNWFDNLYIEIAQDQNHMMKLSEVRITDLKHTMNPDVPVSNDYYSTNEACNNSVIFDASEYLHDNASFSYSSIQIEKTKCRCLGPLIELDKLLCDMKETFNNIIVI